MCIPAPHASRTVVTIWSGWWRGASGIACANDASVKAKASAINLIIASLQFAPHDKVKHGVCSVSLMQIKKTLSGRWNRSKSLVGEPQIAAVALEQGTRPSLSPARVESH
jgi:hypothetical protein